MIYLGIDPGKTGAVAAVMDNDYAGPVYQPFAKATLRDIGTMLHCWTERSTAVAFMEKVSSSPQQGVKSAFTFGRNYGQWEGLFARLDISLDYVSPAKWQRTLGCLSKGDKTVTKRKAQELFPNVKVTHAIADALLIAEYCRRMRS